MARDHVEDLIAVAVALSYGAVDKIMVFVGYGGSDY